MAYSIDYNAGEIKKVEFKPLRKRVKRKILTFVAIAFTVIGITQAVGSDAVKEFLLPGDPAVTEAALTGMIEDIRAGESVGDAITAFCREILDSAGIYE